MRVVDVDAAVDAWLAALEARHLADFRLAEVTRALRALSSAYVERRQALARGAALDSAGKRAAFSLFYGPLHFLTVRAVVAALDAGLDASTPILDLGCGSGVCGAAWRLTSGAGELHGVDRHPAAVEEARWTYRQLGLGGSARQGDVVRTRIPRAPIAVMAGYVLNELTDEARVAVWQTLRAAVEQGATVLIVEPIARSLTPWWHALATEAARLGARADEWRFPAELPTIVARLDQAAGLRHRELTARSLYIRGRA